jgi:hypothetical protein
MAKKGMFNLIKSFIFLITVIFLVIAAIGFGMWYFFYLSNKEIMSIRDIEKEKYLYTVTVNNLSSTANQEIQNSSNGMLIPSGSVENKMNQVTNNNQIESEKNLKNQLITPNSIPSPKILTENQFITTDLKITPKNNEKTSLRDPFEFRIESRQVEEQSTENTNKTASSRSITPIMRFSIQGYMEYKDRYAAIINGKIYEEGDKINGWTIKNITTQKVTIIKDTQVKVLSY